jgi:hypothetical protein
MVESNPSIEELHMKTSRSLALPPYLGLIAVLRAGFDAVTNHLILVIFPIALDLLLWLGPRLRLTQLINSMVDQLIGAYQAQGLVTDEMLAAGQQLWVQLAAQFNILGALRTYPVGIPSLMVGQLPLAAPLGMPLSWELRSFEGVGLAWLAITVVGLGLGTLYFEVVSQAAILGRIDWWSAFRQWPWAVLQVILLALFWAVLILALSIPASFLVSVVVLGGLVAGQCILYLYAGFAFWLILPLAFSPQGIFVHQYRMFDSVKASFRLIRKTLPTSVLFILAAFFLSKGLDLLWMAPGESSWLTLVGIAGHAFVTTGLLSASFVYYRDAERWVTTQAQPAN